MIGRQAEIETLQEAYNSNESEFVVVYGRRRIGKTFLVNEHFGNKFAFRHSGIENADNKSQLLYFKDSISYWGAFKCPKITNWREAFNELARMLEKSQIEKKVVFLDEVPWLDAPRSGFLAALEHFWNGWACLRKDIVLVICGSATSWIINSVLRNRGGLYNRVTKRVQMEPFTLKECEEYSIAANLNFTREQIAEYYMALGGVAYYWGLLKAGLSVAQNFERLFFARNALLDSEYRTILSSLFKSAEHHIEMIDAIAKRRQGASREEIRNEIKSISGGRFSTCLEELVECGLIRRNCIIGRLKKGAIYQLIDPFLLFYYRFLDKSPGSNEHFWEDNYGKPIVNSWRGLAFEVLCFWHIPQIKRALGISGINANVYSWRGKSESPDSAEAQIDMLIDRSDGMINLCEMKYTNSEYVLTREEQNAIYRREQIFRDTTKTRKGIAHTLVTSYGTKSIRASSVFVKQVVLDDLFA